MPKTVETYRTTKALRELVRRAAKVVDKRPVRVPEAGRRGEGAGGPARGGGREPAEAAGAPASWPRCQRGSSRAARRGGGPGCEEGRRVRVVIDSSVVVAALATPNPESASRVVLAAVAAGAGGAGHHRRAGGRVSPRRRVPAGQALRRQGGPAGVRRRDRGGGRAGRGWPAAGAVPADPGDDMVVAAGVGGSGGLPRDPGPSPARPRRTARRSRRAPRRFPAGAARAALTTATLASVLPSSLRRWARPEPTLQPPPVQRAGAGKQFTPRFKPDKSRRRGPGAHVRRPRASSCTGNARRRNGQKRRPRGRPLSRGTSGASMSRGDWI